MVGRSVTDIVDNLIDYLTCKEGGFYSYRVVRHLHVLRRHAELKNRLKRRRDGMDSDRGMVKKCKFFFNFPKCIVHGVELLYMAVTLVGVVNFCIRSLI